MRNVLLFLKLVAAKMKTLTYQLSNLKFVEEGWTLRKPPDFEVSSDDDSETEEHILVPRSLTSSSIKVRISIFFCHHGFFFFFFDRDTNDH